MGGIEFAYGELRDFKRFSQRECLGKKELTGVVELETSADRIMELLRKEHATTERFRRASELSTTLSPETLVRENAHSKVTIEDLNAEGELREIH